MPGDPNDIPVMFGISNCDTIKKARRWLQENGIDYQFHDYKKMGVDKHQLQSWLKQFGWETLINKRGTTWRKLDDSVKNHMDDRLALEIMQDNTSIIKRPVLQVDGQLIIGFKESDYQQAFSS